MPRGNGGVLGPANIPTTSVAKGVWSLMEQQLAQRQGIWPVGPAPIVSDPYFDYTTLLLPGNGTNGAQNNTFLDGSTNNFTITRNGNTTQGTFSPFSQTGWSNYFDGSGDYLSVANNAAFDFGTGDTTVEAWVYLTAGGTNRCIIGSAPSSGTLTFWALFVNSSNFVYFTTFVSNTEQTFTATNNAVPLNAWTHIAYTRSGGTNRLFVNGDLCTASGSITQSANTGGNALAIGRSNYSGGIEYTTGYISSLRAVKGTAVYTAAFSPPTSPLTPISGTSLLTCQSNRFIDNSTNNFTITRNGDTRVVAFSPFNPSASWSAATYGGSGYFDGSGDYLTVPNNTAIQLGTGDFEVDAWVYVSSLSQFNVIDFRSTASATPATFYFTSTGLPSLYDGSSAFSGSSGITVNQWNYVVWTRASGTLRMFVNGTSVYSASNSSNLTGAGTNATIGANASASDLLNGYLGTIRIVKGAGITTSTVPTAPLTAISGTGLLLNFTNAGIYDATSKNDLETVGNAQISTTQSKWGGSSMYFDGTGDYLYDAPTPFIRLGTGDFTIECWVRFNNVTAGTTQGIFQIADSYLQASLTNNGVGVTTTSGTGWLFYAKNNQTYNFSPSVPPAANTWMHIALVRYSGTTKLYVSGTGDASLTAASDTTNYTATYLALGGVYGGNALNGYIQDFRITVGVARYTANFTPPTAAFPTL